MNRFQLSPSATTLGRACAGAVLAVSLTLVGGPAAFAAGASAVPTPTTPVMPETTALPAAASPAAAVAAAPVSSWSPPAVTVVAAAKNRLTPVFATAAGTKPVKTFDNRQNFSGRHVFVVLAQEGQAYKVLLPMRPNGRTGYVRIADVTLYQHDYAVKVDLSDHQLVLYKGGRELERHTVAVGQSKYPTPTGTYFMRELARPSNPRGAYGPYAFGLSAYSNVLQTFGRGDGQIGIHGTNQPKALGTNASHGCIRIDNATITKLAKTLPQGVPVEIVA